MISGSDIAINSIVNSLSTIPYLSKVFGRAMIFNERRGENGLVKVPKVHTGIEYELVLPRDEFNCQSYIIAAGHEKFGEYDHVQVGGISRQFAVVFWGGLGNNGIPEDLESVKVDFMRAMQRNPYVASFDGYADETYQQVFPEFVEIIRTFEANTQWLMYPNAGFRLLFTIKYVQQC